MCVGDLSNALDSAQIHTGLSTSMWRGRGPGAGRFVRCLGPLPLCVVLLVQANRNDASDRCLGPAAECECALVCECALLCECECECGCACYCECACECECECVSGMFQMRWVARRFTPVCRSRCGAGGAGRGPCAGWSDRRLGTVPLRVALCVQANRNDIPDRRLGTAAESTVSGTGCLRRWTPEPRRAEDR